MELCAIHTYHPVLNRMNIYIIRVGDCMLVKNNVQKVIEECLNEVGLTEVQLPTLQPKEIWEKSQRWQKYIDEGVMLTVETEKGTYCIAPTAEEAVVEQPKGRKLLKLDEVDSLHIRQALEISRGRISGPTGAARLLGINPSTLRNRMIKLGIPFKYS